LPATGLSIDHRRAAARRPSLSLLVMVACTVALTTNPAKGSSLGSQPILKSIDPAQAKLDTGGTPANGSQPQPYTTGGAPGYPSENQLPDFNKPMPSVAQGNNGGDASGFLTQQPTLAATPADEQRVTRLEQTAFGSTYPEHEVEDRIDHLEKEVFGNTSTAPMEERLAKLEAKIGGAGTFNQSSSPKIEQPPPAMQPPPQTYQAAQPPPTQAYPPQNQSYPTQAQPYQNDAPQQSPYTPVATAPYQNPQASQPVYQTSPPSYQGGPPNSYQGSPPAYQGGPPAYQGGPPGYPPGQQYGGTPSYPAPVAVAPGGGLPLPPPASTMVPPSAKARHTPAPAASKPPTTAKPADITYPPANADYFAAIKHFPGDTVARWRNFPVRVHLPIDSPESWRRSLDSGVNRWKQVMPVKVVTAIEPADIEVIWVNHLSPQYLGLTKLMIAPGQMQVQIEMLRPTFYLPEIPERELQNAFLHELGHGLGIFGHSDAKEDLMAPAEIVSGGKGKGSQIHFGTLNDRDIKTLKHIYGMPPVPPNFSLPQPLQWGCIVLH
jgi:predicted Zn-dependent protease